MLGWYFLGFSFLWGWYNTDSSWFCVLWGLLGGVLGVCCRVVQIDGFVVGALVVVCWLRCGSVGFGFWVGRFGFARIA